MTKLRVNHLIDEADELLDNKFHIGSYCLFINTDDIQDILSKIRAILPEEIKTAEMILQRRDEIYMDAQVKADRIINEAQTKAAGILSENELIRAVKEKASNIQEQVKESCEEMKNKASEEAETMRKNAYQEAKQTKDEAKAYVEEILSTLERDIDKIHKHVKTCQDYLTKQKNPQQAQSSNQNAKKIAKPTEPIVEPVKKQ